MRKQALEKKQLPKQWKNESRVRTNEFRKGMRTQSVAGRLRDKEEERDRLKQVCLSVEMFRHCRVLGLSFSLV